MEKLIIKVNPELLRVCLTLCLTFCWSRLVGWDIVWRGGNMIRGLILRSSDDTSIVHYSGSILFRFSVRCSEAATPNFRGKCPFQLKICSFMVYPNKICKVPSSQFSYFFLFYFPDAVLDFLDYSLLLEVNDFMQSFSVF